MVYVDKDMFLKNTETYINMAKSGTCIYICVGDGTELKLEIY